MPSARPSTHSLHLRKNPALQSSAYHAYIYHGPTQSTSGNEWFAVRPIRTRARVAHSIHTTTTIRPRVHTMRECGSSIAPNHRSQSTATSWTRTPQNTSTTRLPSSSWVRPHLRPFPPPLLSPDPPRTHHSPRSFTTKDVLKLHVPGGRAVIIAVLSALGHIPMCRLAVPGEFARRVFEGGRLDLTQVEGLRDLVDADMESQRRGAAQGRDRCATSPLSLYRACTDDRSHSRCDMATGFFAGRGAKRVRCTA
jgi:hypothetical protein